MKDDNRGLTAKSGGNVARKNVVAQKSLSLHEIIGKKPSASHKPI
jgi:hypothetical protein